VLGMLKEPIVASNVPQGNGITLQLCNVLVVKNLPVPLHVSAKRPKTCQGIHMIDGIISGYGQSLDASRFPLEYHTNAYWNTDVSMIGICKETKKWTEALAIVAERLESDPSPTLLTGNENSYHAENSSERLDDEALVYLSVMRSSTFDPSGRKTRGGQVLQYINISTDHFVYINMMPGLEDGKLIQTKYQRAGDVAWFFAEGKKFSKSMKDKESEWQYRGKDELWNPENSEIVSKITNTFIEKSRI